LLLKELHRHLRAAYRAVTASIKRENKLMWKCYSEKTPFFQNAKPCTEPPQLLLTNRCAPCSRPGQELPAKHYSLDTGVLFRLVLLQKALPFGESIPGVPWLVFIMQHVIPD